MTHDTPRSYPQYPRLSRKAHNFLMQSRHVHQIMTDLSNQLQNEGWDYHESTRHWTHPDYPGVEITT